MGGNRPNKEVSDSMTSNNIFEDDLHSSIAEEGMFLYKKSGEKDVITGYAGHSDLNEINRVIGYLRNH